MTLYREAHEVARIAKDLIAKVPEHKALADVLVMYVFRSEATKSRGKLVLGKARMVSGLNAFLIQDEDPDAGSLFVVEIAEDTWNRMTEPQRRALVDHELCHFEVEPGDGENPAAMKMKGHDLEEFAGVVERHGFWRSDIATFGSKMAEQMSLAIDAAVSFTDRLEGLEDLEGPEAPEGE